MSEEAEKVIEAMLRDLDDYNYNRRPPTVTSYRTGPATIWVERPTRRARWLNMNWKARSDRMPFAFYATFILAVIVPVLVGVILLLATGLFYSFGGSGHWIRHHVWGWLSDFNFYKEQGKTHEAMTPKLFPLTYFTSVLIVFAVYLLGEGIAWVGEEYAELARGRKITHDKPYQGSID